MPTILCSEVIRKPEFDQLLTVMRTDENRTVCQIAICLFSSGCRLNEMLSAEWSDVDMEKRVFVARWDYQGRQEQEAAFCVVE